MYVHGYFDDEYKPDADVTLISKLDVSNPLHLHPNDSVALTVVYVKLKGIENYQVRSCVMLLALEGKNKNNFIDGYCKRSNSDEVLEPLPDVRNAHDIISSKESHIVVSSTSSGNSHRSQSFVFNSNVGNRSNAQRSQTSSSFATPANVTKSSNSGNCSTSSFSNDQISKLIGLIKENIVRSNGKAVQVNMAWQFGIKVSHPNGTEASITIVGNMILNENLTLYDVLVVPEYYVSLMSVHKVARDNKLNIAFDESKCYVLPQDLKKIVTELNKNLEPKTYWQACKDQHWIEAMNNEMDALYRNDTWEITELPKDRKAIGSKWVFKIKYKSNGEIEMYKARLVAMGFNQKECIDFDEILSHVVKIVIVRCLINLYVQNGWSLCQLDINNAFMYGDLSKTMYMALPEGYFNPNDKRVYRLKKSLYRLKQALRQ
nr:ribonuclease H-like domain-containing protein [Tanacetum cinerariifolium]